MTVTAATPTASSNRLRSAAPSNGAALSADKNNATPPLIAPAESQSRSDGHCRTAADAMGSANNSWVTSSGCTKATEPKCNAAAWEQKPQRLVIHPSNHTRCLSNRRKSHSTGNRCVAALRAGSECAACSTARRCKAADAANRNAAVKPRTTGSTTNYHVADQRRDLARAWITSRGEVRHPLQGTPAAST